MAAEALMTLDNDDIQGIVLRGYRSLPEAEFCLLHVNDAAAARTWLGTVAEEVMDATANPEESALNVAFTYRGLQALGLSESVLASFAIEFQEGMTTQHRSRILGDLDGSAPEKWVWGGPETSPIHVLVMMYASTEAGLGVLRQLIDAGVDAGAVTRVGDALDTRVLVDQKAGCVKEHFGFCDGESQPVIEGLKDDGRPEYHVKAGEFLLGYPNEYERLTAGPVVAPGEDPLGLLPPVADGNGELDLGRNGTYLVFRQLEQDVKAFWQASANNSDGDPEARTTLAAKMVGRWPDGTPLAMEPEYEHGVPEHKNDFEYHDEDPDGLRCPIGAHIRRANPRDSLGPGPGTDDSIKINRRHQLLRRGRTYGEPLDEDFDVDKILAAKDDDGRRGLHFICCNANIARQFEFVQHTWVNNPKFAGLYEETDPLIGTRNPPGALSAGPFTIPERPVRRRVTELPSFVEVRGGAYFFLPGLNAVRYLAAAP